jgi:hypothetical protein
MMVCGVLLVMLSSFFFFSSPWRQIVGSFVTWHVVETRAFVMQHQQNHATHGTSTMYHVLHDATWRTLTDPVCPGFNVACNTHGTILVSLRPRLRVLVHFFLSVKGETLLRSDLDFHDTLL